MADFDAIVVGAGPAGSAAAIELARAGASAYYFGGAVLYTRRSRRLLTTLTSDDTVGMRSSSLPYAQLLARHQRTRFRASWGLAETGAAGPAGNTYGDPAGHSCLAVDGPVPLEPGLLSRLQGYSVLELAQAYGRASGRDIPVVFAPRRPGDVAACYADPAAAEQLLGWKAEFGIDRMCEDAWRWQSGSAS